jgi:cell division protein FtsW
MAFQHKTLDTLLLGITGTFVIIGSAFFISASLGLLARESGPSVSSLAVKQLVIGLCLGSVILYTFSRVPVAFWRRTGFFLYLGGLLACLLVFVPGLGFEFGGARRWIIIFGFSLQPAELLKFGVVTYYAALLAATGKGIRDFRAGVLPILFVLIPVIAVLFLHPDLGTLAVITTAIFGMYIAGGGRAHHIALVITLVGLIGIGAIMAKPYALQRVETFLNPGSDPAGAGYQITQSLTAIGAGQVFGRGFGQGIQKFRYLPEPVGDSIFAVIGEEFGFIGTGGLIILYLIFTGRALTIATKSRDRYGGLVVVGIVILIVTQSFFNMASMLGLLPLSGMPLVFVSQGGTALVTALASVGVILSVSRMKSQMSRETSI